MEGNDLPLLELFTRLREAGLPLGIDEYQLVLQAMQAGFGMSDTAGLKRLCQTLWVKSLEEKQLFEYHFKQFIDGKFSIQKAQLSPATQQSKISQIIDYVILGSFGVAIILGYGLISNQQTQPLIQTSSQNPSPQSTPTKTQNLSTNPTSLTNSKPPDTTNTEKPDWIAWNLLLITRFSYLYICLKWAAKFKIEEKRINCSSSVSKVTLNEANLPISPEFIQVIEDEVQVAQAVLNATSRNEEIPHSCFILTTEYFPVTERQMKQIWRYLRRPVREGSPTELDVEATINQIVSQGLLLEPVLVPHRVNKAQLLLLIDQDGSMVPFHALSRRLSETALYGGRLGKSGIYYFHNCPIEYLYHDPYHQQAELVSDIVTHVCTNKSTVLIFSDAGAARGRYSEERYDLTKGFLEKLNKQVRYIAWLNPMPRKRWFGTTADDIASLVPMFEVSRRGLLDAIGVLRGRPTNFEGRKM
ncbi:hypothetical protein [Nostoc sp. 106C]|uniref:hypothetical protein n=1 Tax=Nostoc sp. 106C TaxID=1932667 RepID=UPI000A382BE4|nr:hypothetical protein [Nostoc sp. 106C]OUL25575.1 hypothetical protein BV375_22640 [Nostoc sp. 106C]